MSEGDENKKGIKFDATINLGHILTFIGFLVTGAATYSTLDSRIVTLEVGQRTQELRDRSQDAQTTSQNIYITETLSDIKRAIEKLNDKVDRLSK